jgi:hypothetical protein
MVPFRDKVVLVAKNRLYRRTAVGYSAISGSLVSRISLISFSFGFQQPDHSAIASAPKRL